MALLILAGAAALHAQILNSQAANEQFEASQQRGRLVFAARVGTQAIAAITQQALDMQSGGNLSFAGDGLSPLHQAVTQEITQAIEAAFPLIEGDGVTVDARLDSVSIHSAVDEVELYSAFGGRSFEEVPTWVEADASVHLTVESRGGIRLEVNRTVTARSSLPLLLPISLSARIAAELQPGGLAGRIAGQIAQRMAPHVGASSFETWAAVYAASSGVRAALATFLGYSANESFDGLVSRISSERSHLLASDFYPATSGSNEQFPMGFAGNRTATSSGVSIALDLVSVEPSFTLNVAMADFNSQELRGGLWRGYRFHAEGSLSVTFAVSTSAGSATVGPLQIPISFSARAGVADLSPAFAVDPTLLSALETEVRSMGALSAVGAFLSGFGLLPNSTSPFSQKAHEILLAFALNQQLQGLPPLEDASLFWAAYGAERALFTPLALEISSDAPTEGRRASVTIDGAHAGAFMIESGRLQMPRAPLGIHSVGVSMPCAAAHCVGGAELAIGANEVQPHIVLAPVPDSAILREAGSQQAGEDAPTAEVALRAVARALNLQAPADLSTGPSREAFAWEALENAQSILDEGLGSARTHAAAEEARDFLKIVLVVIDAWAELEVDGGIAAAAGTAASVAFSPTPNTIVKVTRAGVEVLAFVLDGSSVVVTAGSRPPVVVKLERLSLALLGVLAALNLVSNTVKVQDELSEGDSAGSAIAASELILGFSDAVRAISAGLIKISNKAAFKVAEAAFAKATVILGAALLVVEFADLYHEHDGNLSSMAAALIHPTTVAGLLSLPSLIDGAVSVGAGALLLAYGAPIADAGPLGIAAGLFVLAVVIVLNGEFVASKLWGTMTFDERATLESALGNQTKALSRVVASANSIDAAGLERCARSMGVLGAQMWAAVLMADNAPSAGAAQARAVEAGQAAHRAQELASTQRALRHAAIAALLQLDDFSSEPYSAAAGRSTEGYGTIRHFDVNLNFSSSYPYDGEVRIMNVTVTANVQVARENWSSLLLLVNQESLPRFTFGFAITNTNAIPLKEAERFLQTCNAAGERVSALISQWQSLAA